MAINPNLVSIIPASELPTGVPTTAGQFFFYEGNEMKKSPMTEIYELVSGLKGTLKITDAAPTVQGLYILSDVGTYANLGGIVTTAGKINYAYFNGTTWSLIAVDINTDEVVQNFIEGNIQSVGNVAEGNEDNIHGAEYIFNLPEHKMVEDRYLKNIELNLKNSGKIVFSILNHNSTNNTITVVKNFEFDFVNGNNIFEFNNEKVLEGQIIAINKILSDGNNAKVYFSSRQGQTLTQYKEDGTFNAEIPNTGYNFMVTTSNNLIDKLKESFVLKGDLEEIKQPYTLENKTTYGSTIYDFPFGALNNQEFYLEKNSHPQKKFISKIEMYAQTAGTITLVFGLVDQNNIFIPRKEFNFQTTANEINIYNINDVLRENEVVAVKLPSHGLTWKTTTQGTGRLWYSSYGGVLSANTDYKMAWEITMFDYIENSLAFKSEIEPLKNDIVELKNKPFILTSQNGTPFKLTVGNDGTITAKSQMFGKIAHLGNSICKHPITTFWWGFWGMAATVRENDYVHRFLAKYQTINASATTEALNIATWENNHTTYDKTQIDSTIDGSDLIVVRVGENVTYSASFKDEFRNLINYIIAKEPQATILIGGTFWYSSEKDADMKAVADELGITFVSMQGLDTPSNRATLSTQVYGDDNQWHTISDGGSIAQGVADHPNDLGMEAIAQRLFNGLGL